MGAYECVASLPDGSFAAQAEIADDAIVLHGPEGRRTLPFVDLMDMRLLNYHLHLAMRGYEAEISQLGYQTEDFFEKLWKAYEAKSREALFIASPLVMESEGDYSYAEPGVERQSIAKLELHADCLCIVPHDVGARRVPLCFSEPPVRDGFAMTVRVDTGEWYRVARLGHDTDPFFSKLADARDAACAQWQAAHRRLEGDLRSRLGDAADEYRAFQSLPATVSCGLFAADDESFWFAAISEDRAAVELVTDEKAATYLYRFDTAPSVFESSVRHAMEAVKKNRRIIFLPDDELVGEPLYRMAIDRSAPVRFLRSCNAGRIIHTERWDEKLRGFFA